MVALEGILIVVDDNSGIVADFVVDVIVVEDKEDPDVIMSGILFVDVDCCVFLDCSQVNTYYVHTLIYLKHGSVIAVLYLMMQSETCHVY
jgi:hypothetical protein